MKNRVIFLGALVVLIALYSLATAQEGEEQSGKKIFEANKCASCHSMEVIGIKKRANQKAPDLSTIGSEQDAEVLMKFLKKKEAINGVKHAMPFKGTDEELAVLTRWLETQKAEETK